MTLPKCSSSFLGRLLTDDTCSLTLLYVTQHSDSLIRTLRAVTDSSNVALATPEATVFEAMLGGWESQQHSRGLRSTTIATRRRLIVRLQEFSGKMPWEWNAGDVEDFISGGDRRVIALRSEEHTSELQSRGHLVCRLLLEIKNERLSAYVYKK